MIKYYCDDRRHVVCLPYSVENLHKMAEDLNIKKYCYRASPKPNYKMPKKRINEITQKCTLVGIETIRTIMGIGI